MATTQLNEHIRYEPDEHPPNLLTIGAGVQAAAVIIGGIVLGVAVVFRIADQPETYLAWGVFAALLISGATTILQAARVWRIGAGHILVMGTSGAFFAVCVAALVQGAGRHGQSRGCIGADSVRPGGAALRPAPRVHPGGLRHRDHADRRHRHAHRF